MTEPRKGRCQHVGMILVIFLLLSLPFRSHAGRIPGPLQGTAHNTTESEAIIDMKPPPDQPDNTMSDSNMAEAVKMWCEDPNRAMLFYGHISEWNTSAVTNFRRLFRKQTHFNDDISRWDTSRATSMSAMFQEASSFDQDLSHWDTSNVVSMSALFADAVSFTGTKGSMAYWNVEKVTRMDRMFENAVLFQGDLSHWKTVSLHHVDNMFRNAVNYRGGQDLANWKTAELRDLSSMFHGAIRFNGNISLWDTRNALEMDEMFHNAISFDQDLSSWDTSKVVTMARMFRNATKFTGLGEQGAVGNWNVENVTNFYGMFEDNPSFQADVSSWNPAKADNMERMFYNATAFGKYYSLPDTISSSAHNPFSLLCWDLPNGYLSTEDALCGSNVRFDPCCTSIVQFETSCCNKYCDKMETTCQHPDYEHGATQGQYSVSTGNMEHGNVDEEQEKQSKREFGTREEPAKEEATPIGWMGGLMIGVIIVLVVACLTRIVKYC